MTDRLLNISIRIAGLPRIPMRIPAHEEENVRLAEANINELWQKWSAMDEFRDKTSAEVLAMVTFRFAQLYYNTVETSQKLDSVLQELEKELDSLLLQDLAPFSATDNDID